mmetsp:Transcript_9424/g.10748  ORF Transcript_9424/g.10748 Transcript_9424/m.10748 type:complete len:588 (-) Transcript_9424:363-2126(-)|eukprot:CAMPEP_0184018236 /NCGR_PEP_ID=MMETSP0954-20121128/8030_1 /TAXON_ID=627963 /ORGANISM="Aplanochytrium sp, Strain PBS07" /LENGTH=587 /DNA_ID=CAMNT_0026299661 /DNA_START=74 /DNA_END=1837 /DNA_ORIENTATION=-
MGKGKKKGGGAQLGRALLNGQRKDKLSGRKERRRQRDKEALERLGFEASVGTTKSITEHSSPLDEFLSNAVMAGRSFATNRYAEVVTTGVPEETATDFVQDDVTFDFTNLPIPRRPKWTKDMSAETLDDLERHSFLAWRRQIAQLEESSRDRRLSPFEKNLAYWRQLWRVVERSDLVVQVVDARNPLLFRSLDMEKFVKETGEYKQNILLINKADFLTEEMRKAYTEYFKSNQVRFLFFSAKCEQAILEEKEEEVKVEQESSDSILNRDSTDRVLTRQQLLDTLLLLVKSAAENRDSRNDKDSKKPTIGMTGYPNVGKSSVINVLFGVTSKNHNVKRVSVASTPGHTKHYQTLHMTDGAVLCDCPGLVFPTFMNTKADLLCNGILPIDEIRGRDWVPAVELVCRCIPRKTLEDTYSMPLPLPPNQTRATVSVLIETFCRKRGLTGSGHGRLNESMGARILLKDFVAGKLAYVCPPPGFEPKVECPQIESLSLEEDKDEVAKSEEQTMEEPTIDLDEEALIYKEELRYEAEKATKLPSRRLLKHGRKHKKARDKDPYSSPDAAYTAQLGGKHGKGKKFTRKKAEYSVQ